MPHWKKETLKTSYYRSFLLLIVVPILVITLVSTGIIRTMMRDAAIQNIKRAQDNIVSTLNSEVKDASLRLSHFVYVNDNEIMKIAAKTDTFNQSERYDYTGKLAASFNYAMVPVQDVLSTVFFMKSGRHTYMKDDVALSKEEIKQERWYQEALEDKNMVKIGLYGTRVTTSRQNAYTMTIAAGFSPAIDVDRDEKIEMAALFVASKAGALIRNYNKEQILGTTLILDRDGNVLLDADGKQGLLHQKDRVVQNTSMFERRVDGKKYVYVVSREPQTGCSIVNIVEAASLTRNFNKAALVVVAVTLVLFALFYRFSSYFLRNIIKPVHNVVEGMEQMENGNLDIRLELSGQAEIRTMVGSFNSMVHKLKHLMEENEEQQKKKHEAEIRALQSQINPHFLVNSLNSIRFMAQVAKFEGIRKMAEALIKILSTSFRSNSGYYTVKEELEVLDSFVYLMQIRYSDNFEIEYQMEDGCENYQVPRLILQPLVENSIVHGFNDLLEEIGQIRLHIRKEGDLLCFTIRDNGKGMSQEEIAQLLSGKGVKKQDHTSIGVVNVLSRLQLNYGERCRMLIESEEGSYTVITLYLPAILMNHAEENE